MPNKGESASLREIFTRDFLLLATINLTMFFGFQMTNVGLPVYVAQLGANAQLVGLVGTVMTITAVVVRIFAGPLLDRFGRKGALVGGSIIMAQFLLMIGFRFAPGFMLSATRSARRGNRFWLRAQHAWR